MTDSTEIERIMQVLRDRAGMQNDLSETPAEARFREIDRPSYRPSVPSLVTVPEDSIPMLTEVVEVPRYSSTELPEAIDDVQWAALSERVELNVMERMLRRTEQMIDAKLNQDLSQVIARATQTLSADLATTISESIRDLVSNAVADELTRLQSEITFGLYKKK
jgi:hypothetical protein